MFSHILPTVRFSGLALVLLTTLAAALSLQACDGGGSGNSSDSGTISGQVTGLDAQGASVVVIDANGTVFGRSSGPVQGDGRYSVPVAAFLWPDHAIIQVEKDGRILRAAILGYPGQGAYEAEDTFVTPDTEAAVLLCTVGQSLSVADYVLFLQASVNGTFAPDLPQAVTFPYRDLLAHASALAEEFFEGETSTPPNAGWVQQAILGTNHYLLLTAPIPNAPESMVNRALTTPDGSARLVLGYDPRASVLSATSPVTVEVSSQSDGAFQWTEYTVDLGPNVLAQASVRLVEAQPMGPKTAVVVSDGGEILTLDGEAALDGSFVVASSNAAGLVDIDKSGLVPAADNLNGVFTTIFTQEIGSSKTVIAIDFQPVGGKAKRLETISVGKGTVFSSSSFSLTDSARTNRLVVASVVSGSTVLYALQDFVDWTRFQSLPPVISAFTLAQTRASAGNMTNSLTDSHDRDRQPVDAGTVYSHYLLDLDVLLRSRAVPNWADTAYGQNPPADGTGRIPVVLLHGWQGNVHYRSAARLCDWEHSPVNNFSKLISYYLGTPALNQKYHLYLLRWPSYKHLTMSGELFGRLLADVRLRLPGTDLGRGLSDSTTGVVVITHSTGGLIARTAIETHKAFAGTTSDYDFLRKAIILAGPHHGTPEAVNTWPNNWSFLANKDVATQATSDLSWDSFDGNANIYFSTGVGVVGHRLRYDKDRAQSRWPVAVQNVRDFDQTYLNALGDLQTATYNPWLLWFTKRFATIKDRLAPRYILYSGWTRVTPDPGNFVNNSAAMAYTQTILAIAGYHNDSVLPVCSNLMATSAKDTSFYLPAPSWPDITQDWYPHSRLFSIPDVLSDRTVIVIGSGKDHPLGLDFRLIWDFDHGQTKDGALSKADQADVAGLIDEPMQTKKTVSDDFWMEVYRQGYVRGAMAYNTGQTPSDKELETMTNVLKSDPFFLILEKDLLDVAG